MANVGDTVTVPTAPHSGRGTVCWAGPVTCCVQFATGCFPFAHQDLVVVAPDPNAPQCTAACSQGNC
jgi:hypothetical protein